MKDEIEKFKEEIKEHLHEQYRDCEITRSKFFDLISRTPHKYGFFPIAWGKIDEEDAKRILMEDAQRYINYILDEYYDIESNKRMLNYLDRIKEINNE